jgi:negative regulator of flagellin synthesis FlgM
MKILSDTQQPAVASQTAESKTEKIESEVRQQKLAAKQAKTAKPSRTADKVDLSASVTAGSQTLQDLQTKRVESIKARIEAGTYEVSSRDVAEKMLSGSFDL